MHEILQYIENKNSKNGFKINAPSHEKTWELESKIGFKLPYDFNLFYSLCDGFECDEDIFNFLSINTILERGNHGDQWFVFAEYMFFSDSWGLKKDTNGDLVFFSSTQNISSNSLIDFLKAFAQGNVFETGGIYEWVKEKGSE
ncbi:hypothetical protein [Chryseobacterium sp.]|uniref:hypothetical protein n=1 Tax=Chryseobacterium sp. TaxID=1871047 RepID=UPI0024E1F39D|nr:hypothetical protein [Chryseobacterium sp.]